MDLVALYLLIKACCLAPGAMVLVAAQLSQICFIAGQLSRENVSFTFGGASIWASADS